MSIIFKNIKELLQVRPKAPRFVSGKDMNNLPTIQNAYLRVEDGKIADYGEMTNCPVTYRDEVVDATGKMILPCWCDSHTHIVYAGNRETEFVDRIHGLSYEQIAKRGGGILNSAKKLQDASEEEVYLESRLRLEEVMRLGTGAIEIKSGYGLNVEAELKILRIIKRLSEKYPVSIKSTLLAAHAVPSEYKNRRNEFVDLIIKEMIPKVAQEQLADYIDVFCEKGYFTVEDTELILKAGKKYNLIPKIHVNQFNAIGGVGAGVNNNALTVDHLEVMNDDDIASLKGSSTMPVALPGCSYFLGIPYTPVRRMMEEGLPIALASDFNPGSCPSGNMNFVVSTACVKMKMTPAEAINAATINGAYAMGLETSHGTITEGKIANLIMTKPISSYAYLPYAFGSDMIQDVYIRGNKLQ